MDETEESEKRPFVLCELESLKHVLHPLKSTQRIKYTCFGLSQKLLVFGATSGSLYIFKREPCTFLHLLPSKDGCITKLAISPDEKIVAYASNKGVVNLLEHNVLQSSKAASRKLQISHEHAGCEVTAFQWNSESTDLYIGDTSGRVSVLCVSVFTHRMRKAAQNITANIINTSNQYLLSKSCQWQPKNIFQTPSMQLMQLDSSIVQMDFAHGLLLISTLTRCYMSDTEKEQYKQVGQKLRDGEFGACFVCKNEPQQVGPLAPPAPPAAAPTSNQFDLLGVNESLPMRIKCNVRVFCARPGSRLWEVNCDGSVISTHQFKEAITTTPPSKVITPKGPIGDDDQQGGKGGFNFPKLNAIGEKFLLTYRQDGVYIFDPDNSVVVLWSNVYSNIADAQVWEDTVYLWLKSGQMHALTFQPVEKCILKLYFRKEYPVCAQLCHKYLEHLIKIVPSARKLHFISDLAEKLSDHSELRANILPLTSEILKFLPCKQAKSQKLKSGIYRVGNVGADSDDEGKSFRILRSLSGGRAKKVSDRARSLSSSPKRRPVNLAKEKELPRNNSMQTLPANGLHNGGSKYLTYADVCHDSPFTIMSSPETIAALHDLTNVLSSKLKQKWMSLEGRMKAFSQEVPLLDVGKNSKPRARRDTGDDGLEILIPNGRTEAKPNGTEPSLDINVSQVKESIQSGSHELILQSCLECFEKHHLKWAQDSTESFPFKSLFNPTELATITNALHNSFQSKFILGLLPAPSECKQDESYPEIFKTIHSDHDLSLDLSLSKLITAFGEVLDEFTILQDIIGLDLPCYFGSWCSVLNFFQQQVLKFITSESKDDIREAIMHRSCPLPRLLNVMYLLLRVSSNEGIDICLSIGENVTLRDFCYVVLKLQQQKIAAGNASQNIQRYCQNILLSFLSKKSLNDDNWADIHVYSLALEAFVNLNLIQSQPNCNCGYPLPGTNRRFPLQFLSVGNLLLKHLRQSDEALYLATCRKLSLWAKVVAYRLEIGASVADILALVLQLDSVQIFDELLPKLDEQQFERALQITRALDDSGNCLNCSKTLASKEERVLNWTFVGQSAVKLFGPDRAIALFDRNTEAAKVGLLKKSFFQSCILASLLSEEPSRVIKVVDLMQHKGEAKHLFDTDVGGRVMEALSKDLALQGVLPTQYMPPATSKDHHWGVQVRLWDQKCPRCSLPFADNILLKEGGVRIFPCSHAFHMACLGDFPNNCLQCKVNSYEMQ